VNSGNAVTRRCWSILPAHTNCGSGRPPDWSDPAPEQYTVCVPASRSDAKILLVATASVVLAGLLVAAVLLLATSRSSSPTKYAPFPAGVAQSIKSQLKDGGPFFYPDPFGGDRNILLAIEHGEVVALSDILPSTTSCRVKWRGSIDSFVDCHGDKLTSGELARYRTEIGTVGVNRGELLIDLRHREPPPAPA
jgi:hypothetical protein